MLGAHQLSLSIGNTTIIQDLTLEVEAGSLCVIVGQNGSGKSSLLRCLSGWNKPTKGKIVLGEYQLQTLPPQERAALLSFLPQRPKLSESIPIVDVVAAARFRFSESPSQSRKKAQMYLQQNQLHHLEYRDWNTLSGGEAQRVVLTCLQAQDAKVWLLDEPANHLDPSVQGEIYQHLVGEWRSGRTLILVTHNINLILGAVKPENYAQVRIVGLQQGSIQFDSVLSDPSLSSCFSELYQIPVQQIQVFGRSHLVFGVA